MSPTAKYKALTACWFGTRKESKKGKNDPDENCDNEVFIERDTLVTLKVACGKYESTQSYQILSIFSKYYNKWFFHLEDEIIPFVEDSKKKCKVLVQMTKREGGGYNDVELTKGGEWIPKEVYRMLTAAEVIDIRGKISSGNDMWEV